jgi:Cu(I)/Ag(I) efflux system membrane fusion protein
MAVIGSKRRIAVVALVLAAFAAGYGLRGADVSGPEAGPQDAQNATQSHEGHGVDVSVTEEGEVVWTCSMHPQIQLPEPGKCPICFMDLIPLERSGDGDRASLREIALSPEARKLAGITVDEARRMDVAVQTRMVGKVEYDETRVGNITAWTGGRIDRMYVDYTGSVVKKGQPMVSIYSPELLTAQAELIQAIKAVRELQGSSLDLVKESAARTEKAAREKLRLLGLTRAQIDKVARRGEASDHITLYAPQGGVVIGKDVNEGQYVKTGASIYSIADLSQVWVVLEAYETDLPWVDIGRMVEFQTKAYPGKVFRGEVVYIDPLVNEKTRTVRVRLSVPNPDGSLKPGMLVHATQKKPGADENGAKAPLVIPASAPLITGKRAVVYVADPAREGVFEGREVVLGPRAGEYYIVKSGLKAGEHVVTKGNFKIDSAVQIIARPSMMNPDAPATAAGEVPPLFASKLILLDKTFTDVKQAVASKDLSQTHLAFGRFNKELRLIDGSDLEGDAARIWREYSMRLGNDAILGAEAATEERLEHIFAEMQGHYAAVRGAFGVGSAEQDLTAPQAFRTGLGEAYAHYDALAQALAEDDTDGAKAAAARLAEALAKLDAATLSGPSHAAWTQALATMTGGLDTIRDAQGLVDIRAGFEPVSAGLTQAVQKLGVAADGPVYEMFCPMAFDYEGATWLQRNETVRNPYFGAAMLRCGEVTRQLAR